MKWDVRFRPAVAQDIREARDWYELQRAGLGEQFLLAVSQTMEAIEESPMRQPEYYKGFRRIITPRFPYKVFYRVEGTSVIVFRVLHAAREHTWVIR